MNKLAQEVEYCIQSHGIKKSWIAEQLGISQQLLNKRLNKKNFTLEDTNEILAPTGFQIKYTITKSPIYFGVDNESGNDPQ